MSIAKRDGYAKTLEWLNSKPPLDQLCERYPDEWASVQQDISAIVGRGDPAELKTYLQKLSVPKSVATRKQQDAALSQYIRSRMAHEAVKKLCSDTLAVDAGASKGRLRFNLFNGYIAQKLLFSQGLQRKPASLFWFRLLWPLLWQRKMLMPLVQPRGIYCFYSSALIDSLSEMIASRSCLEIGAGDGTLTRFLQQRGVQITATDNHAWKNAIDYPEWVVKLDARTALAAYSPEVVICSWPPAQNDFERCVFDTPSVQLYIVIGSRNQFGFGNWQDYRRQTGFELETDEKLGALLLPPELESAVYLFRRKVAQS